MRATFAQHARSLRIILLAAIFLIPVAYDQVGHGRVSVDIGAAYAFAAAMTYLVLSRTLLSGNGDKQSPPRRVP